MAKNKVFNIHDLYPADYRFDEKSFFADPEGYEFTPEDIAYFNAMELEKYEREFPMTYYEKTLLRKRVMSGHSPSENPGSRYLCLPDSYSCDFLTVHRMDKEIRQAMKGMNKSEQEAYLMEYMGWTDDEPDLEGETPEGETFWKPTEGESEYPF